MRLDDGVAWLVPGFERKVRQERLFARINRETQQVMLQLAREAVREYLAAVAAR